MLNIEKKSEGKNLSFVLSGRLDTTTAPDLEKEVKENIEGVEKLDFDFEKLEYISSSGLRAILKAQKAMQDKGGILIRHANKLVMGVFQVAGFDNILRFEE